ncbi:MAG: hypothetical protein ACYCSF_10390 [Acidimicrobiales bacterium]
MTEGRSHRRPPPAPGLLGGFLDDTETTLVTPVAPRREHPAKVWGTLAVEGEDVVVRLSGWRALWAMKRRLSIPLSAIVAVTHDPAARSHVRAKLRRRGGRTGVFRVGAYHSLEGWSFWAVGLARNAVVVEASGARYHFVVIEVADPVSSVRAIRAAAGLGDPKALPPSSP